MNTKNKQKTIAALIIILPIIVVAGYMILKGGENGNGQEPSYKILFIGTDHTAYNKGFDYHIEMLASSVNPPLIIKADKITQVHTPLEGHWEKGSAQNSIKKGDYDAVVLQEVLPFTFIETFHEYARKFDTIIKEAGAETVLLMIEEIEYQPAINQASFLGDCLGFITIDRIEQAHREIAEELECKVAPWGLAFHSAMDERPDLNLWVSGTVDPNIYGTYLAVNVVYATIFDESPEGLTYVPTGMDEADALFLQRVAWDMVQKYREQ